MQLIEPTPSDETYLNPVFKREFPDPFVWKFCGEYWAICTGLWHDNGVFGVLRSSDLINWIDCGSAIESPPFPGATCYWAPEVFYENGKFYLYYSVGNEEKMEIRVAVADSPDGKYFDSGYKLTNQSFAIDAHVFIDPSGVKYLFYATDFLEHSHIGTGTVRDQMISPFELSGNPLPVTRAKFDWQVYDPSRMSKGGVRWHTVEGSAVLKRKDIYYQMFSGGNWQNISYGVSYAITKNINQTGEWQQDADGKTILPILQTIPGKVIGPGHNSVVRGPDNLQLYCVYHCWSEDLSKRQMAIDKLDFKNDKMFVLGANGQPQIIPNAPTVQNFFDKNGATDLGIDWESEIKGEWLTKAGIAISNQAFEKIETSCRVTAKAFLVEVSEKAFEYTENSGYGFCLKRDATLVLRVLIMPGSRQIEIFEEGQDKPQFFDLSTDFEPKAFHLWRIEVDSFAVKIKLDEAVFQFQELLSLAPNKFALATRRMSAAVAGFSLTIGFENLFDSENIQSFDNLKLRGWQIENNDLKKTFKKSAAGWKIKNNFLQSKSLNGVTTLFKNLSLTDFELIVNARFVKQNKFAGSWGVVLRESFDEIILTIEADNESYFLQISNLNFEAKRFSLPNDFKPNEFQQFRFRLKNNFWQFYCANDKLGEIRLEKAERQIGLRVSGTTAIFEMVRLTAI